MNTDQLLKTITNLKIEIVPTVNKDNEVVHWYAGFKKPAGYGEKGVVHNTDLARGRSIEEAVAKLLAGQTMFGYSEDRTGIEERRENW